MPTYCYSCEKCGQEFEVTQKITDDAYTNHNQCDNSCDGKIKRIIQVTAFHLKQGGWTQKFFKTGRKGKKR